MTAYAKRLKGLRGELKKRSLESLLVSDRSNVTYLSGFTGDDSVLFVTRDSQFFLTDSRYIEEAKNTAQGFAVMEVERSTYETVGDIAKKNGIKRIGFESMNLPYQVAKNLEARVGRAKLVPQTGTVEALRTIKDKEEIARIKASVALTRKVLKDALGKIRPGIPEDCLSAAIECEFIRLGARSSFPTIAACGANCSRPHARPGSCRIGKNDAVMLDIGCCLRSYCSDMTRMVLLGKVNAKIKEIYHIVSVAQKKAIDKIKPGARISDIDTAGRQYINDKGYGKFFRHSIGHGVGLEVHEEPSISRRNTGMLKPGMVFTVEPAIYIPRLGGVRIEDMVLVTDRGCEILTR
jgi:Xaa-Pro aminopeptidase